MPLVHKSATRTKPEPNGVASHHSKRPLWIRWAVDPGMFVLRTFIPSHNFLAKVPPSSFYFSPFCCTPIGNFFLSLSNWEFQTPLSISSSYQDIFQTPNRMTLTIGKHFGTWLFSYTTSFSSHSPEKRSLSIYLNRLLNTLDSSAVSGTVSENKSTHFSTSRSLALGDMFVFSYAFLLAYLNIPKRIMTQLPTYWYNTDYFWVGECIGILCSNILLIQFVLGYPAWRLKPELKRYYLMQIAYWCQQMLILVLGLEKPRKDYWELVGHHLITLWLVG